MESKMHPIGDNGETRSDQSAAYQTQAVIRSGSHGMRGVFFMRISTAC